MRSFYLTASLLVVISPLIGCGGGGGNDKDDSLQQVGVDTRYVLPDAIFAAVINVRQIHESPVWEDHPQHLKWSDSFFEAFSYTQMDLKSGDFGGDIRPENINRIVLSVGFRPEDATTKIPVALVAHFKEAHADIETIKQFWGLAGDPDSIQKKAIGAATYYFVQPKKYLSEALFVHFPDKRTAVVVNNEKILQAFIAENSDVTSPIAEKLPDLDLGPDATFLLAMDDKQRDFINTFINIYGRMISGKFLGNVPEGLQEASLAGSLSPDLELQASCKFVDSEIATAANTSFTGWTQNCLSVVSTTLEKNNPPVSAELKKEVLAIQKLLSGLQSDQNGTRVDIQSANTDGIDGLDAMAAFTKLKLAAVESDRKRYLARVDYEKSHPRGFSSPTNLKYVLPNATLGVAINVHQAMQSPVWENNTELKMHLPMLQTLLPDLPESGLNPSNMAQVFASIEPADGPDISRSSVSVVLQLKSPHAGEGLVEQFTKSKGQASKIKKLQFDGQTYFNLDPDRPLGRQMFLHIPNENTILFAGPTEQVMQQLLKQDAPPDSPLAATLNTADMTHDIVFVAIADDQIRNFLLRVYAMYLGDEVTGLLKRAENAVVSGTFSPNARYEAALTFSDEKAASEMRTILLNKLQSVKSTVETRIEKLKPLPDANMQKQVMPELKAFLDGVRSEQTGKTTRFFVVGLDDMNLIKVREAEKWLAWGGDDNGEDSSEEDSYGSRSNESDPEDIESTIKDRVQYHIDHLTEAKYKSFGPELRVSFCEALGKRGTHAKAALPHLQKIADDADEDESVRKAATQAIKDINSDMGQN